MIFIGIDDTDSADSRGTNQLAKSLVRTVLSQFGCLRIVRHQLLFDDRIPYTSKNGSASIWLEAGGTGQLDEIFRSVKEAMLRDFITGSDPGLCVTENVPPAIVEFGKRCQQSIVTQDDARQLASEFGLRLEGLGGTNGGLIGALAAVGLAATADDGRIVHIEGHTEELSGPQPVGVLDQCGVAVIEHCTQAAVTTGVVDIGKKLRPNLRAGRVVLFAERSAATPDADWTAIKLK